MSCTTCPQGVVYTPVASESLVEPYCRVETPYNIPLKEGFPLSTPCERATIVGSIPEIVRYPAYTMVFGEGAVAGVPSNGGIGTPVAFFKDRRGCYADKNNQQASTCA